MTAPVLSKTCARCSAEINGPTIVYIAAREERCVSVRTARSLYPSMLTLR